MAKSVNSSVWFLGTALAIVVILAGTWFGFSSAKFAEAGRLSEDVAQAEHQNSLIQARVQALQADFAKLDDYKAEIAGLQVGIPPETHLSSFVKSVSDLADEFDVYIADIQPVNPVMIVPTAPEIPETPATDAAEGTDGTAEGAATAETPPASTPVATDPGGSDAAEAAVVEGFAGVPILFTAVGEPANVEKFMHAIQTDLDRLFLVTAIEQTRLDVVDATGGLPDIFEGWIEINLTGYIYVLADQLAEPEEPTETSDLPNATDRNPYIPIEGRDAPESEESDGEPSS